MRSLERYREFPMFSRLSDKTANGFFRCLVKDVSAALHDAFEVEPHKYQVIGMLAGSVRWTGLHVLCRLDLDCSPVEGMTVNAAHALFTKGIAEGVRNQGTGKAMGSFMPNAMFC